MALGKERASCRTQPPLVPRLDATEADLIKREIMTAQAKHSMGDAEGLTCFYRNSCHTGGPFWCHKVTHFTGVC